MKSLRLSNVHILHAATRGLSKTIVIHAAQDRILKFDPPTANTFKLEFTVITGAGPNVGITCQNWTVVMSSF